jgi:formamidopyrimidine-DNA glycosylase
MPELPEVENARRYLIRAGLPGRTFTRVNIGWHKTVLTPSPEEFVLRLSGAKVNTVDRRGKYLLLSLSRGDPINRDAPTLIIHLGMTGGLRIQPEDRPGHPMVRHIFSLDDGRELRFIDGRKFGKLWLAEDPGAVLPALGPEPLGDGFTLDTLAGSLGQRGAPIKALLLEQSIVAGMGNLYADEALFLSGIHPLRPARDLAAEEVSRLREGIMAALQHAVAAYDRNRDDSCPDPPLGVTTWTIPRKSGDRCPRCGGPISAIRVRGRGTRFCPRCQG